MNDKERDIDKEIKRINQRMVEYAKRYGTDFNIIYRYISNLPSDIEYHFNSHGVVQIDRSKSNLRLFDQVPTRERDLTPVREYNRMIRDKLSSELNEKITIRQAINIQKKRKKIGEEFNSRFFEFYSYLSDPLIENMINRDSGKVSYEDQEDLLRKLDELEMEGVDFGSY